MQEETGKTIIFEEGISLSTNELRVFKTTFETSRIQAAYLVRHRQSKIGPLLLALMGAAFSVVVWWLGLLIILSAVGWLLLSRSILGLEIVYSGQQINILYHRDTQMMRSLHTTLLQRINQINDQDQV